MKLIVGLGNPTTAYKATRHNLGFMIIDEVAKTLSTDGFKSQTGFFGSLLETGYNDEKIILLKPATYMNNSGKSVTAVAKYYKIELSDTWVIHDELDLKFGTLRLRRGGSSAGHNGIKSITQMIGEDFVRFRVGIGNELSDEMTSEKFVLSRFSAAEQPYLGQICVQVTAIILDLLADNAVKIPPHSSYQLIK